MVAQKIPNLMTAEKFDNEKIVERLVSAISNKEYGEVVQLLSKEYAAFYENHHIQTIAKAIAKSRDVIATDLCSILFHRYAGKKYYSVFSVIKQAAEELKKSSDVEESELLDIFVRHARNSEIRAKKVLDKAESDNVAVESLLDKFVSFYSSVYFILRHQLPSPLSNGVLPPELWEEYVLRNLTPDAIVVMPEDFKALDVEEEFKKYNQKYEPAKKISEEIKNNTEAKINNLIPNMEGISGEGVVRKVIHNVLSQPENLELLRSSITFRSNVKNTLAEIVSEIRQQEKKQAPNATAVSVDKVVDAIKRVCVARVS